MDKLKSYEEATERVKLLNCIIANIDTFLDDSKYHVLRYYSPDIIEILIKREGTLLDEMRSIFKMEMK
jgi:hypothetical protein